MATSAATNDVVNWAYQYSLASAKLSSAQANASSSATRSKDIPVETDEAYRAVFSNLNSFVELR